MPNHIPTQTTLLFRSLSLIFTALVIGQLAAFVIFFQMKPTVEQPNSTLQFIAGFFAIGAILGAPFLYMTLLRNNINLNTPLEQKLRSYFSANLVKLAVLESAALFCLVCLLITGKLLFAYLFIAVFFSFMLHRPSPAKCAADLQLTEEDKRQMVGV